MTKLRIAASLVAAASLVTGVLGCGASNRSACVVIDASRSTRYALSDYLEQFEKTLEDSADAGGSMAVVVATGDPLVESSVEQVEFDGLTGTEQTSNRTNAAGNFASRIERAARLAAAGVQNPTPGSGILASIALVADRRCTSITAFSDGLETTEIRMKRDDILTARDRERLLDGLANRGLLPDLNGVELRFPLGGFLPQGTAISRARLDAVPMFWRAYAGRTGASLTWRQ